MIDKIPHIGQPSKGQRVGQRVETVVRQRTGMAPVERTIEADHDRDLAPRRSAFPQILRLAIVVASGSVPEWIRRAIDQLLAADDIDVTEITVRPSPPRSTTASRAPIRSILERLDARIFGRRPDPMAPGLVPVRALRGDTEPDLTLVFGGGSPGDLRGDQPVWTIEFGNDRLHDPDDAAMRAIIAGEAVIGARLVEHVRDRAPVVRASCVTGASRHSPRMTRDRLLWAAVSLPARAARQRGIDQRPGQSVAIRRDSSPATARAIVRTGARTIRIAASRLISRTEWILAYSRSDHDIDAIDAEHCASFTIGRQPVDRFWADPFPVIDNGRHWIFVEEWMHGAPHAHLAVIDVLADGSFGPSVPVLEKPYHLSYPHVFRWMGEFYMIPETRNNRTIELYRSFRFPFDWRLERVLMRDLDAVDASVIEIDGWWWMFVAIAPKHGVENDQLHLFSAETPLGLWRPHPMNPIVSDVRRARPAGRVFRDRKGWIRPSQDCSVRYGHAIGFNRITTLSATAYAEEQVSTILPTWTRGIEGTHTFNHAGDLTVIDAARPRSRLRK